MAEMRPSIFDFLSNPLPFFSAVAVMVIGSVAWYFTRNSDEKKLKPYAPLHDQSIVVGDEQQNRISRLCTNGILKKYLYEDVRTLYDCLRNGMKLSSNGQCLGRRLAEPDANGRRPYVWMSFDEVIKMSEAMARFYVRIGLAIGQQTFVGIYSRNRPEWIISEQACYVYSMVNVPLYDTLGQEAVCYIIEQTEMMLIVCENTAKVEAMLKNIEKIPKLRFLVVLDEFDDQNLIDRCARHNVQLFQFDECLSMGMEWTDEAPKAALPTPESLATVCYTSGTTDMPKGVMLTHGNIIADCTVEEMFAQFPVGPSDSIISYLPLAHMFERLMETCTLTKGGSVGYYSGDVKELADDMQELKPTLFPVVPRLLNRIYDKVHMEASKNVLKKFIFDRAMAAKAEDVKNMILRQNTLWDRLVFNRVRQMFGGRVRLVVSGSAPTSNEVLTFFRVVLACVVCEGYGQTECTAAATLTQEGDHVPGQVGPPIPANAVKVVDVPEMNYFAKDGCGEICIKGANVFQGYFKQPDKTSEVLDSDGWLHTGDIGRWTECGTLQLIDRKKHIFKLSQGEYIAPEKLENVYLKCRFIMQIFVHGDSLKSCVVAVVVPDMDVLKRHMASRLATIGNMTTTEICKSEAVKKLILEDMIKEGKKANLCSFEQVKDIYLQPEPFTVENDLLTPTFKSKRPRLRERFKEQIDNMYSKLN